MSSSVAHSIRTKLARCRQPSLEIAEQYCNAYELEVREHIKLLKQQQTKSPFTRKHSDELLEKKNELQELAAVREQLRVELGHPSGYITDVPTHVRFANLISNYKNTEKKCRHAYLDDIKHILKQYPNLLFAGKVAGLPLPHYAAYHGLDELISRMG